MVDEKKFKDLLINTCHISSERRVLELESQLQRFNTHWVTLSYWEFKLFSLSKTSDAIIGIILNFVKKDSIKLRISCEIWLCSVYCRFA